MPHSVCRLGGVPYSKTGAWPTWWGLCLELGRSGSPGERVLAALTGTQLTDPQMWCAA